MPPFSALRADGPPAAEPVPRRELVARYLRGGFFFLQLALQLGSLTVLGYGQWASLDFSGRQASVVGIALIASFVLTGPATQVIGYLGPYFAESGKHLLSARAAAGGVLLGLSTLLVGYSRPFMGTAWRSGPCTLTTFFLLSARAASCSSSAESGTPARS